VEPGALLYEGYVYERHMKALVIKTHRHGTQKKPLMVTVGLKVSKKATERNLIKRRIRAIITPIAQETGKEYTIIAKPEAKEATFGELTKEIEKKISNF